MRYRRFGTNLIDSFSRVQQLLVTLLFLPGISDSDRARKALQKLGRSGTSSRGEA
jgi:hypothetical protein